MMATLILVVCLGGGDCRDERLSPQVAAMDCAIFGQVLAQDWLNDHPKYRLAQYRCEIGDRGRAT